MHLIPISYSTDKKCIKAIDGPPMQEPLQHFKIQKPKLAKASRQVIARLRGTLTR